MTIPPSDPVWVLFKRHRDLAVSLGLFCVFIICVIALAAATGWSDIKTQLSKLGLAQIMTLLALSLVNYLFRATRWHLFTTRLGLNLAFRHNILHFLGGFALSITPGRVGELVRLRWISRMSRWPLLRLAPLPLVDRAYDMAAMGGVLAAGMLFAGPGTEGALPVALLAIGAAIILTRPGLVLRVINLAWAMLRRWPRIFARLRQAARSMVVFSTARIAVPAMILGTIGWVSEGIALFLLLGWMGAELALPLAVVIFLFSTLAGGLTGMPGGIGGAEAAMVFLLHLNGVPLEIAVPATAVIRVTSLWFAIGIGAIAFTIAERQARNGGLT